MRNVNVAVVLPNKHILADLIAVAKISIILPL